MEPGNYRSEEEVKEWLKKDPIANIEAKLVDRGVLSTQKIWQIKKEIKKTIEQAVAFAKESDEPLPESVVQYVFA